MVADSLESNSRAMSIFTERRTVLEQHLKEAEEKQKFYLSALKAGQNQTR